MGAMAKAHNTEQPEPKQDEQDEVVQNDAAADELARRDRILSGDLSEFEQPEQTQPVQEPVQDVS
jgi:hypothetical protein